MEQRKPKPYRVEEGLKQLLCGKLVDPFEEPLNGGEAVILNVYSITKLNKFLQFFGVGFYHTGVQIYGKEFSYGGHDQDSSGIMMTEPHALTGVSLYESFIVGFTRHSEDQIEDEAIYMSEVWKGKDYEPFNHNCNHFTKAFLKRVLVHPGQGYLAYHQEGVQSFFYPPYINRFTGLGPLLRHWFQPVKKLFGNVVVFQEGPAPAGGISNASFSLSNPTGQNASHQANNFSNNISNLSKMGPAISQHQNLISPDQEAEAQKELEQDEKEALICKAILEQDSAKSHYLANLYEKSLEHARAGMNLLRRFQLEEVMNEGQRKSDINGYSSEERKEQEKAGRVLELMKNLFLLMINCDLKLQRMQQVVQYCNALLGLDPKNIKGYLKRAQAHVFDGNLEWALRDLSHARELDPHNPLIEEEFKKVQIQLSSLNQTHEKSSLQIPRE